MPGNKLACALSNKVIQIWNLKSGQCEYKLKGHEDAVTALCLVQGNKLASGSRDKTIKIWNNPTVLADCTDEDFDKLMHNV